MKITGETMTDYSIYQNPLCTRYASKEMQHAFSDEKRFKLWRKLWIALAESEMELGLNITPEQVAELKNMPTTSITRLPNVMKERCAMTLWRT